jgi:hypothetical protein
MQNHEQKQKSEKPRFYGQNKLFFLAPCPSSLGSFSHMVACRSPSENIGKMNLNTRFEQNFTMGSYGVEIGRAWYSWKAYEICSSLV